MPFRATETVLRWRQPELESTLQNQSRYATNVSSVTFVPVPLGPLPSRPVSPARDLRSASTKKRNGHRMPVSTHAWTSVGSFPELCTHIQPEQMRDYCRPTFPFTRVALRSAIKSSFRGDYPTSRSHCFLLCALDASVHFEIRSLAQHRLSSADFSVHRDSSCSYRRSGVVFRSRWICSVVQRMFIHFTRPHSADVPSLFYTHAGSARWFSVCSFTSLGLPGRPPVDIPRSSSPNPLG